MRTVKYGVIAGMVVITMLAANVQGAFIVEPHPSGLANANFTGWNGVGASIQSGAWGLAATNSVYGDDDDYTYSYTPGTDVDNVFPVKDLDFGNGDLSTGMIGGETGFYNVYITWVTTANVDAAGCKITITSDGDDVVLGPVSPGVDMKTGGTGSPGANSAWYLIAEKVELTAGITYTVNQLAHSKTFVSQRSAGVMWQAVEPDYAPVTITESDDSTDVIEGDTWDDYTVVLDQQPTSDFIYVNMVPDDDPNNDIVFVVGVNDNRVSGPVTLTFTPADWDLPQTVRVEAVDDDLVELDHYVLIRHSTEPNNLNPLDPPDPAFVGGFVGYVKVNITDNETPDVRIRETGPLLSTDVGEHGLTDTYLVKLLFPPTNDVTLIISADDETEVDTGTGPGMSAQLIFTSVNWNDEQTVTVSAIDDIDLEYAHTSTITHSVSSLDLGYNVLTPPPVVVNIEDNECKAWGIAFMDFNEDCVIGIADFAEFAAVWLECTQPYAANCVDLR